MKRKTFVFFVILASVVFAGAQGHGDAINDLLLALVILLPVAKLAGMLAEKLAQPAVMGELVAGLMLGNLSLLGIDDLIFLKTDGGLEILAQLGVILLLFEIGLDASLADLMKVGVSSLLVAAVGVVLPFILGWLGERLAAARPFLLRTHIYWRDALRNQRRDHGTGAPRHRRHAHAGGENNSRRVGDR